MMKCPTCSRRVEQAARYCPDCYTVFPSGTGHKHTTYGTIAGTHNTWRLPALFILAIAAAWFVQTEVQRSDVDEGFVEAASANVKRWIAGSENSPGSHGSERFVSSSLDNDNRLPCPRRKSCKVIIRFPSGDAATFVIERPLLGDASIDPLEPRGAFLLGSSLKAQLLRTEPSGGTRLIPIARESNEHDWSVVGNTQAAAVRGSDGEGL